MAAKPDLSDGWLPYAHELDAALAVADFTKGARLVLREVFAQIFGMAKLKSATLSPSGIASVAGMMREHVSRAIKELVDSGVLVRLGDGTYRFIKDYESWTRKGERRLTQTELGYCRSARDSALAYAGLGRRKLTQSDRNDLGNTSMEGRNSSVTEGVPESLRDRNSSGTESVPESLRSEAPAYRIAGAEFETGELRQYITDADAKPIEPKSESIPHEIKSQPSRTPEDLALVHAAEKILAGDLRTEVLAWELGKSHNLRGLISIPGWKWVRAAEKITGPGFTDSQRRTFKYFATIAENTANEDQEKRKPIGFGDPSRVARWTAPLKYEQDDPAQLSRIARIERSYELTRLRNEEKRKCG